MADPGIRLVLLLAVLALALGSIVTLLPLHGSPAPEAPGARCRPLDGLAAETILLHAGGPRDPTLEGVGLYVRDGRAPHTWAHLVDLPCIRLPISADGRATCPLYDRPVRVLEHYRGRKNRYVEFAYDGWRRATSNDPPATVSPSARGPLVRSSSLSPEVHVCWPGNR